MIFCVFMVSDVVCGFSFYGKFMERGNFFSLDLKFFAPVFISSSSRLHPFLCDYDIRNFLYSVDKFLCDYFRVLITKQALEVFVIVNHRLDNVKSREFIVSEKNSLCFFYWSLRQYGAHHTL